MLAVTVVSPRMGSHGWPFAQVDPFPGADEDPLYHSEHVKDLYIKACPDYGGRSVFHFKNTADLQSKSSPLGSPSHYCGTRSWTRSWTMRARSLSACSIKTLMISSQPRKPPLIYIPRIYDLRLTSWMPGFTLVSTVCQTFSLASYQWQIHIANRRRLQIRLRNHPSSLREGCRGSLWCPW